MSLDISTIVVTPFMQNCRILCVGGEACVVDPGGDVELIVKETSKRNVRISQIWLTHSHLDHCGGVAALKRVTGAELLGHKDEELLRSHVDEVCEMYGIPPGLMENSPEPDRYIAENDTVTVGNLSFKVLFTPGHSPGHLSFYNEANKILISGDTLFQGSIGRTDLPGGNYEQLIRSIKEKILTLPTETKILPGHGPDTTVGVELKSNPFFA